MLLSCRSIPLSSIKITGEWNLHPWELQEISVDLEWSLKAVGLLHPPIVQEIEEGHWTVVNGCKRLLFLKTETNLAETPCMIIGHNASFDFILNLLLADLSNGRSLTLAEKCRFIQIAARYLDHKEIAKYHMEKLGIKRGASSIPKMLNVLEQDTSFIRDVHEGRIGEKMMMELLNIPEVSDRTVMVQLFRELGMGDSKQKRFFTLLRDNAYREGSTLAAYLDRDDIQAVLNHEQLNIPQKIQHLSVYLQQQLTPSLEKAEKDFFEQVKKLHLPPSHSMSHTPSFEKDEVTLSIKFRNLADCKSYLVQNRR